MYEEALRAIDETSRTQAPAILVKAVENAVSKGAFNGDGGVMSLVARTLQKLREPQESRPAKFAYSTDGECYSGDFGSREAAIEEAKQFHSRFWVGQCVPPTSPADMWHAEDWLEHVSVQDEYSSDWCDGWDESTKEQREELDYLVWVVLEDWLQRHGLHPRFFSIIAPIEYQVEDGKADALAN